MVLGLKKTTHENQLRDYFEVSFSHINKSSIFLLKIKQAFGRLQKLKLITPWGAGTGLSKGFGFLRFENEEPQKRVSSRI